MDKQTFIEELATRVLLENDSLEGVTMIFPNRRAGLFFRQALSRQIDQPVWLPEITSLEDFILKNQHLQKLDTLEGIFTLFEIYKTFQREEESFDQFYFWGEMILRDFNEIDHYLIDPEKLFTSIKSQKELDEEFYFLDEEERKVIQSFWASFLPKSSKTQEAFLQTWKILLPIYEKYQSALINQGKGYMGLIYRQVCGRLEEIFSDFSRRIYFAGFNALTKTEEEIFRFFVREKNASIAWDVDDYYFKNKKQEAGFFFREYAKDTVLERTFQKDYPSGFAHKHISKTGVSLEVGQVKSLAEELEKLASKTDFKPEKTVVVLPQEHMLFAVLHSLPDAIDKVNITMGLPLKETPVYSLLESLLILQNPPRKSSVGKVVFFHKPLTDILDHPMIKGLEDDEAKKLITSIRKRNQIVIYEEELRFQSKILKLIFRKATHPLDYLLGILQALHEHLKLENHGLELEYLARYYDHLSELRQMIGDKEDELNYDFLIKLFRKISRSLKVPFTGEPLNGLQIMGILETRNLDFEHVFVLNMNEDAWPAPPKRGSFIPYNIRRAFDLPVQDHHDAIYAYLFYRLLQRAQVIDFYYNTVSEFNLNGEVSRLVQQLEIESELPIYSRILSNPVKVPRTEAIQVEKNESVLAKMNRYLSGYQGIDASGFTPSALNIYLDCKLKFYFRYVEKLWEPDEIQEDMDARIFGNILHNAMELIYKSFAKKEKRNEVYPQDFFGIKASVAGALQKSFMEYYGITKEKNFKLEGKTLLAWDILKKYINRILDLDESYAPFRVIGLEASTRDGYAVDYAIKSGTLEVKVRLKGVIDRIDFKKGKIRVLDYKTGRDSRDFSSVASFIDRTASNRNKAVFQVFYYSWLFQNGYTGSYEQLEPGILNSSDIFKKDFDSKVYLKEPRKAAIPVTEFRQYQEAFETVLQNLLTEMYDPEVPFDQTDDFNKCGYCSFKEICGR